MMTIGFIQYSFFIRLPAPHFLTLTPCVYEKAGLSLSLYQLTDADIFLIQCHPQEIDACLNI